MNLQDALQDNPNVFVVHAYGLEQAIEDNVLIPVMQDAWELITGGIPVVATSHLVEVVGIEEIPTIWNEFVLWDYDVKPTLPEEEQMFQTVRKDKKVWCMFDNVCFTLLFAEDY